DAGDTEAGETGGTQTSAHRIEGEADPLLVVTDGAPGLIAGADPRRNGDDYPMTSLSDGLGPQKDPNSGRTRVEGERRRRPIASGLRARGHRRIDAGDIDAGETWGTETSAHRIEGEADPLLVVTDGAPGLIAGADPRRNGDDYPMTSLSDGLGPQKDHVDVGPAGAE